MFSAVDFVVFGAFLLLSLCVGLYHGVAPMLRHRPSPAASMNGGGGRARSKTGDFLDGGRRLPVLPVCLSLLTTFVSGIGLLGVPAEIYTRGSAMCLFNLFGSLAFPMIGAFFIPIFFKLKCLNSYEYFELRFHSGTLRRLATLIFMLNTLVYMAIVIYAPSIALSGVTSLSLWPFILLVGLVSTVYTAAGGIKAVIWTDTLQAVFIYAGLGIIIVKGTLQAGGFLHVMRVNELTGRLWQGLRTDPSPLQYNNIWIESVGGVIQWTCIYGLNQMAMQRYCSMPSLQHARLVLTLTIPANLLIQIMIAYIGFLMVAFFDGCDPVALGEVQTIDQMTILMANRIFDGVPGLPGLFLATIFSATLSTASSGINSLTAVVWEDFLKDGPLGRRLSDTGTARLMKGMSIFFGFLATGMAFACSNFGGIFQIVLTILGATSGPVVGLFFLGIFFPRANKFGAFFGLALSALLMLLMSAVSNVEQPYCNFVITDTAGGGVNTSAGCVEYAEAETLRRAVMKEAYIRRNSADLQYGHPDAFVLSRISPFSYSTMGLLIVLLAAIPVSLIFRQKLTAEQKWLSLACTWKGVDLPLVKPTTKNEQSQRSLLSQASFVKEENGRQ